MKNSKLKKESKDKKFKKIVKIVGKVGYWVVFAALLVIAVFTMVSALDPSSDYKIFVIQSGSMEPAIKTGSVVVVKTENTYRVSDIVTYVRKTGGKDTVTHRIIEVKEVEGVTTYITQGDANESPDISEVPQSNVIGGLLLAIPLIGYPVQFAKTLPGLIFLIIVPAVVIVYSEILNIIKEIKKTWGKSEPSIKDKDEEIKLLKAEIEKLKSKEKKKKVAKKKPKTTRKKITKKATKTKKNVKKSIS